LVARRLAGLDEAGRGCVIGPMAVAGVLVDEEGLAELVSLGVKDSKALSPSTRERLASCIRSVALAYKVVLVQPEEIDKAVARKALNRLEANVMARIICDLCPDVAYVDASDVVEARFASMICACLPPGLDVQVIAKHGADARYPVVAAASILAKVERDRAIAELKRELGVDFGSGYPTDARTIAFIREWCKRHKGLPSFVRRSWRTARRTVTEALTAKLDKWGRGKSEGGHVSS